MCSVLLMAHVRGYALGHQLFPKQAGHIPGGVSPLQGGRFPQVFPPPTPAGSGGKPQDSSKPILFNPLVLKRDLRMKKLSTQDESQRYLSLRQR